MNEWMDEFNEIIDFDVCLGDVDSKCIIYNFAFVCASAQRRAQQFDVCANDAL